MLLWIGYGLALSTSALVVGWKRLTLTMRPSKQARSQRTPAAKP
ncbi:MAG: hypothetical protein RBS40_15825 [Rhodocyclaceae bacterium]|jgi:hypothetical protein|nr:hypothetical protein [Rhodocyclaceae bacterium]